MYKVIILITNIVVIITWTEFSKIPHPGVKPGHSDFDQINHHSAGKYIYTKPLRDKMKCPELFLSDTLHADIMIVIVLW